MATYQLHWFDYVTFGLSMLVTVLIGVVFALSGGRQKTTAEYFTADRQLSVIPAALSIIVSYMSAVMIIGVPAESYLYGGEYILAAFGTGLGTITAALFVVPILYPLKLLSINHVSAHLSYHTLSYISNDVSYFYSIYNFDSTLEFLVSSAASKVF